MTCFVGLSGATAITEPPLAVDHLVVHSSNGWIEGSLSPGAAVRAELDAGTAVKATRSGRADASGHYTIGIGYDSGHSTGIHNGDLVRVTDESTGRDYAQQVHIAGLVDEETGLLSGTVRPFATVTVKLYTNGDRAVLAATARTLADGQGSFRVDFSRLTRPKPAPGRPPWRGYVAEITERDLAGQAAIRQIQTPNATLLSTSNQAGGAYFLPADEVSFRLVRGAVVDAAAAAVADADGVVQVPLPGDVQTGDVLQAAYHDRLGGRHQLSLRPWSLTAAADNAGATVSGTAAPGAPVIVQYYAPEGLQSARSTADAAGHYRVAFQSMTGGRSLVVQAIADPGFTGVGTQQVGLGTPVVRLDDVHDEVSGYGALGVASVTVTVSRGGAQVAAASATTRKDGSFTVKIGQEVLPGDRIDVRTGAVVLPSLVLGSGEFVAHRVRTATGWSYTGTGTPGRRAIVVIAAGAGACTVAADIPAGGTWSAPVGCPLSGTERALVEEVVTAGPGAGSYRGRWQNVTAPDIRLASPAPGATVHGAVTVRVDAFDFDDNAAPSAVVLWVDGSWVQGSTVGHATTVTLNLPPGVHRVGAVAEDALGRRDASGAVIYSSTAVRTVAVS